jgi:hypothetical protein
VYNHDFAGIYHYDLESNSLTADGGVAWSSLPKKTPLYHTWYMDDMPHPLDAVAFTVHEKQ